MDYPARHTNGRGSCSGRDRFVSKEREYSRTRNGSSNTNKETTPRLLKFQLHGRKVRQTATYTKVLDAVIFKIQSSFEQIIT